jgi:hypothetical protein
MNAVAEIVERSAGPIGSGNFANTLLLTMAERQALPPALFEMLHRFEFCHAPRLGRTPTAIPSAMDTIFLEGRASIGYDDALALAAGGALVLSVLGVHTQDFTSGDFSLSAPQTLGRSPRGEATMPRKITLLMTLLSATVALMLVGTGNWGAIAGTATPNVAGTWEGTWSHRHGSGRITLQLAQEGTTVTGRQSVVGVTPLFGAQRGRRSAFLGHLSLVACGAGASSVTGRPHRTRDK